jgi:hypothetical protein
VNYRKRRQTKKRKLLIDRKSVAQLVALAGNGGPTQTQLPANSSPVVNKANEFVGIIFDGNIQSLILDCIYSDKEARAVSVDSAAISEALRKVYDAGALVDELGGAN